MIKTKKLRPLSLLTEIDDSALQLVQGNDCLLFDGFDGSDFLEEIDLRSSNWIAAETLLQRQDEMSDNRRLLLNSIQKRRRIFPKRFMWANFLEQNVLMAVSQCHSRSKVCSCGLTNRFGKNQSCGYWKLCSFCSSNLQKQYIERYLASFYRGKFWLLTISHRAPVTISDAPSIEEYWIATRKVISELKRERWFRGALLREELSAHNLFQNVIEHSHLLVDADQLSKNIGHEILARILCRLSPEDRDRYACPDVHCKEVTTLLDFFKVLQYLCKCVPVAHWYKLAWPEVASSGASGIESFNDSVDNFLEVFDGAVAGRRQIECFGSFRWSSRSKDPEKTKRPLFIPADRRDDHRELIDETRQEVIDQRKNPAVAPDFDRHLQEVAGWHCIADFEFDDL